MHATASRFAVWFKTGGKLNSFQKEGTQKFLIYLEPLHLQTWTNTFWKHVTGWQLWCGRETTTSRATSWTWPAWSSHLTCPEGWNDMMRYIAFFMYCNRSIGLLWTPTQTHVRRSDWFPDFLSSLSLPLCLLEELRLRTVLMNCGVFVVTSGMLD